MQQFVQCGGGRTGRTPTHRHMRRSRPDSSLSALIESRVQRGVAHQVASPGLGAVPKALNEPAPECTQGSFSMMHLVSQQCPLTVSINNERVSAPLTMKLPPERTSGP